jgi:RimJ/RimL family protein N-acetyltransferase
MYPVRIGGSLTVLREFTAADLDDILAIVGDDQVTRTLSFDSRTRDQAAAMLEGIIDRTQLEPRTEYYLAITLPEDNERQVAGFARLGLDGVRAAKLGYALTPGAQGHGYAADACRALIGFGFGSLGLHRVSAAIGPGNTASVRLVERLGFTPEGTIRDHVFTNGAWRDSLLYSVLEHEWPAERRRGAPYRSVMVS